MERVGGGIGVALAVAALAVTAVAAWALISDDRTATAVSILPGTSDEAGRWPIPADISCPDDGRGVISTSATDSGASGDVDPTNHMRGQAVPFDLVVAVPDGIGPAVGRDLALEVALSDYTDPGPAAFESGGPLTCVSVDTTDPRTLDGATAAHALAKPLTDGAGGTVAVDGLDPGDTVVVEIWAALTSAPGARPGIATAEVMAAATATAMPFHIEQATAKIPVAFGTAEPEPMTLSVNDDRDGVSPGQLVTYEIVTENTSTDAVVNDPELTVDFDPATAFESIVVDSDRGIDARCTTETSPPSVRCTAPQLLPGESIRAALAVDVLDTARAFWLRDGSSCATDYGQVCTLVHVSWLGTNDRSHSTSESASTAIIGVEPKIALAKYPLAEGTEGPITMEYLVIPSGSLTLSAVTVRDDGCDRVTFIDGDDNGNEQLEQGEEWRYRCRGAAEDLRPSRAVVTAVGDGEEVGDIAVLTP